MTLDELKQAEDLARKEYGQILADQDILHRQQQKEIEDLRARHRAEDEAHFGEKVRTAAKRLAVLEKSVQQATIEAAKSSACPVPDVLYVQWDRHASYFPWHKTGKTARVRIYDPADGEAKSYPRPQPGEWCLRVLKKDGSFSKIVAGRVREEDLPWGWYPEGVDPNTKEGK